MLWMKHRDKGGVWHLANTCNDVDEALRRHNVKVTACRGDMLFGTHGPIVQDFAAIPLSPSCVRCAKIYAEQVTKDAAA